MKLTILGCSGSVPTPGNPASGYLLSFTDAPSIVIDLGPGTLAALQEIQNPSYAHLALSHLHADHCMDFPSLMVWRRFHPTEAAPGRNFCLGPADTPNRLGRLSADEPDGIDDMSDTFAFQAWQEGQPHEVDEVSITPFRAIHPIETYALRIKHRASGKVLFYTADTAYSEHLIDAARGADIFMAEAGWGESSEGKAPEMHMSGGEAGRMAAQAGAKTLLLVHLQPWADVEATVAAARAEFAGEIILGAAGMSLQVA